MTVRAGLQLLGSRDGKSTLLKRQYQYDTVGRLLQATSRLGIETFAFDPAGHLLDEETQELNRPLESNPRRNKMRSGTGFSEKYEQQLGLAGIGCA